MNPLITLKHTYRYPIYQKQTLNEHQDLTIYELWIPDIHAELGP